MRRWALERKKAPHPAEAERGAPPSYVVFLGNEHRHGPAELVHRVRDLLDLIVAVRARVTDLRRQRRATAALDIVGRQFSRFRFCPFHTWRNGRGAHHVHTAGPRRLDFVREHL